MAAAAASAGTALMAAAPAILEGAVIAGSAINAVGMVTGSKTLQKIGGVTSMLGGLGKGGMALSKGMGASSLAKGATGATTTSSSFSKNFLPSGAQAISDAASSSGIQKTANEVMGNSSSIIPEMASNGSTDIRQRMKELLGKYDTTANVLAGLGQGFIMNEQNKLAKEELGIHKDKLEFEKQMYNTQQSNRANVPVLPAIGGGIRRADGTPLLAVQ
jgi:hypothetical protein